MATKNRNRSFLKGTEVPNALDSSPLRRLSDRVILHIAEFLSPASKLTFCLTCRHVYSVIRTRHLGSAAVREAQSFVEARTRPWEVLELEYPDQLECYYCRDLHPIDKIHEYAYLGAGTKGPSSQQHNHLKDKCWKMNHNVRTARFIHPNFSFTVFRMIMKRYRQRKDCNKLLEFLAYRSGAVMEGAQVKQVIATPKIVGDRLLMRLQTAYVISPKEPSRMYLLTRNLLKCPHTNKRSRDNRDVTRRLFQRFVALETVSVGRQEHIMSCQCHFCPTEFYFSLERFEGQGVVLFITKWQDLGNGLSPLDSDLPPVVGRRRNICLTPRGKRLAYESPRDRFEGLAPGEDLQAVRALNYEERMDLFRKSDTRLAQLRRIWDSACWSMWGSCQLDYFMYC
jgi:hypothetical protein